MLLPRFSGRIGLLTVLVSSLILAPVSFSQQWKELYNPLEVRSLYITVDAGDWSSVINDQPVEGGSASQTRADAMFNGEGETPISVEIRRKGATDPVLTAGGLTKVSLKIDFNANVPGQTWNGVRKLSLEIGNESGPLSEGFAWQLHRMAAEAGFYKYDAANAAWVKLYVNGNFHGVYTSSEQRDEKFMRNRNFYSETATWLYKADGSTVLEHGIGDSPTFDHLNFVPFVKGKGNTPPGPDLEIDLPQWIDMESMLTLGACNAYAENADELFKNNGKNSFAVDFLPPNERLRQYYPWDLDSSIKSGTDTVFGIDNPIFDEPWFQRVYQHTLRELIEGPFSAANVHPFIDELAPILGPELASDPFISAGTGSVTALKNWITTRNANVLGQLTLPYVARPTFNHPGGEVLSGHSLVMTAPAGSIYYTTDGTDPRVLGTGAVSGSATLYSGPVTLNSNTNIIARTLSGGNWSGLPSRISFQIASYGTDMRITEIMYNPKDPNTGDTIDNDEYEFIELQNTGSGPVDLSGFYFDGFTYTFPAGTIVAPGDFFLLVRNETAFSAEYPGVTPDGFYFGGLKNGGEKIRLRNGNGTTVISVEYNDAPPWVISPDGMGYSLVNRNLNGDPDDAANWSASANLGGSPGAADPALGYSTAIVFNEVLADGQGVYEDAVELINLDTVSHNIGDWYLSDDARDINGELDPALLKKYRIPNGTTISAGGFAAFFDADYGVANPIAFGLSSFGERVYLSSADSSGNLTGHVIALDFPATDPNVSYGRVSTSNGFVEARLETPTFGVTTPASVADFRTGNGDTNSDPKVEPVVISEIMYNPVPSGSEFIELHNVSGSPVDISQWDIDGISGFEFPATTIIPAGGFVILADSATTTAVDFRNDYSVPASVPVFVASFDLGNSGEALMLEKPNPVALEPDILIERVRYNDKAPWPTEANGGGPSLERLPPESFGMEPLNWRTPTIFGTPGTLGSTQVGLAIAQGSFWDYLATASTPASDWMDPDYNATAWPSTSGPAGYGDPLVVGTVPYGPDPASRYITTYFRKAFSVTDDLSNIDSMEFSYLFDDGIVVYLNDVEVLRDGMPGGGISYSTLASADINASTYTVVDLSSAITHLVQGTNVLAVELHQSGPASTDLVWDAGLTYDLIVNSNDVDEDGMDAAWEAANGLDDSDPNDALLDNDGDGQNSLAEFIAGTDPNVASSVFNITRVHEPLTDEIRLEWSAVIGKQYQVHYSSDLSTWFSFGPAGNITASSTLGEFTDPSGTPPADRFYRIEVIQAP